MAHGMKGSTRTKQEGGHGSKDKNITGNDSGYSSGEKDTIHSTDLDQQDRQLLEKGDIREEKSKARKRKSRENMENSESDSSQGHKKNSSRKKSRKRKTSRRREDSSDRDSVSEEETDSEEKSRSSGDGDELEDDKKAKRSDQVKRRARDESSEEEEELRKRRRRKKAKRREEKMLKKKERRAKEKNKEKKDKQRREEKKAAKKAKKEKRAKGPVSEYGKYGIIRDADLWTKRPEFSAWLQEVKKVNLEHLTSNSEEKLLFKDFMEDYNTATMPSKKYYNLAWYEGQKLLKAQKMGIDLTKKTEMTEFNDEELKRQEEMVQRARLKEEEVQRLKVAMQGGMARDMIEQSRLREEMNYHFRIGNVEEAAKIQKRLDPNAVMYK